MPGFVRSCFLFAALAFSGAAAAQDPVEGQDQADIVVTGTPEEVDRQIRDFVGALTPSPTRSQLKRFEMSICPGVAGLLADQREKVLTRNLSFLKGLYSATNNLYAASQRSEIRRQIEDDLVRE